MAKEKVGLNAEKAGLTYPLEFLLTGLIAHEQIKWTREQRRKKKDEYERCERNKAQLRYALEILAGCARRDMVEQSGNGISESGEADNILQEKD